MGHTLGEGAFGIVANCKNRATGEEFAVKMVDKVETPLDAIKKEAEMLQSFCHNNIVKCHGVFYERCFVCIVMDKFAGGDLVEGLQKHLKERGQINCHDVVHVARQMGAGIQYLHNRSFVHRDIKGDNYLMDRSDMTDPKCHIVLTDFGTATQIQASERLSAAVGTKIFWAPEFFDKDYGVKVDVWGMGVIMYGLVSGRFPFRDEKDVRTKEVRIPRRVHPVCEEFIRKMLEKREAARPSSDAVMAHAWVAARPQETVEQVVDGGEEHATPAIEHDGADDGVKERRKELIKRLDLEHHAHARAKEAEAMPLPPKKAHHQVPEFSVPDRQVPGATLKFEWWDNKRVEASGVLEVGGQSTMAAEMAGEASDLRMFSRMLGEHNIDPSLFGKSEAKTLEQLAGEVRSGAARLMLDATEHKKLVRVVDVVVLRVAIGDGSGGSSPLLLIETGECYPDGRHREIFRLPGTKKEPHENTRQTTGRIIRELLALNPDGIKCNLAKIDRHEEETESPSYPGVRTVYRKEIVECLVPSTAADQLAKAGLKDLNPWSAGDAQGNTRFFTWMSHEEAEAKKVKLKIEAAESISTLVRAPIGLGEEALHAHLTGLGIDVSKFGSGGAKSLKEFSSELIKGEATLMHDSARTLKRVVDVVVMIINNPKNNTTLVQVEQVLADGQKVALNRLPGAKRRPDENQFLSARRILRKQLEIDENQVRLSQEVEFVEDEKPSPSYPGLATLYRKRLIRGELIA